VILSRSLHGLSTLQYAFRSFSGITLLNPLQRENIMNFPWDTVYGYIISLASKFAAEPSSNSTPSIITRLLESKRPIVVAAEPYVEALGKQARTSSYQVATGWTRMALGDGTGERVFAIALGYAVIGLLVAFYLNVFTVGSVKSAGRAVRSAVRQQLLVVKVSVPSNMFVSADLHFR
jgi:E3 ubiquitin-protein ligase MARCH6